MTAQAQGGRQAYLPNFQGDTFDHMVVEYTFDDRTKLFAQRGRCPAAGYSRPFRLTARKVAQMSSTDGSRASRRGMRGAASPTPYQVEHDLLIEAIRGDKPYNDVDRAATATLVGIMGRMAATPGRKSPGSKCSTRRCAGRAQAYAFDAAPPVVPDKTGAIRCPCLA